MPSSSRTRKGGAAARGVSKHRMRVASREDESRAAGAAPHIRSAAGVKRGRKREPDDHDGGVSDSSAAIAYDAEDGPDAGKLAASSRKRLRPDRSEVRKAEASLGSSSPDVYVKIGAAGKDADLDLPFDELRGMKRMALLENLATSIRFAVELKDVPLSDCTVWLLPRVAGEEPTRQEEEAAAGLDGTGTINDVLTAIKGTTSSRLFLRVQLPLPDTLNPDQSCTDLDECVAFMSKQWRDAVAELQAARASLSSAVVPMLHLDSATVNKAAAAKVKLDVLHVDAGKNVVELGAFVLPAIPSTVVRSPKGFKLDVEQRFFLQDQRMELTHEFVNAMIKERESLQKFGVLLSGPNGVGKTAVGVQSFITCFARSMLVVYIADARDWVDAVKGGRGDEFFIRSFLQQNVDLIAAIPALRRTLAPVLAAALIFKSPLDYAACRHALVSSLESRYPIGVIVDEVQKITELVDANSPAAEYFADWHVWTAWSRAFVRMDIASNHGARELRLPSSEDHRLRIIRPWSDAAVEAATTSARSPMTFEFTTDFARQRIVFSAGGIPCRLFFGKHLLMQAARAGLALDRAVSSAEDTLEYYTMAARCNRWWKSLSDEDKAEAAKSTLPLLRGQVSWTRAKPLYDDGLVARFTLDTLVSPVSPIAASVIALQTASHMRSTFTPLRDIKAADARGIELERQVLSCLISGSKHSLQASRLDCSVASNVDVSREHVIVFKNVSQISCDAVAKLYIPLSAQYACDAISVPATSSPASEPIVIWETSVTDPREPERVAKCLKWLTPSSGNNIIQSLQMQNRPIVCALCWPEALFPGMHRNYKSLDATAARVSTAVSSVTFVVVGVTGLQALRVQTG